ncbi:MAG: Fic family protein [Saprospiraceae bacterium]
MLENINRLKAELDALRPLDAERQGRIMQKFRLDWNYHSNHLEGNSLTYGETKALILFGITAQGKPLKDHLEMTGHNEAIKWIEEVVKEERPLTESFIRQLHELLLKEPYEKTAITPDGQSVTRTIQVGAYKTTPNHVKTVTGEIFYFATPEETPAKMHDLMEWYRQEKEKGALHPLLLAAEFHYKFIIIHPFDDGNGRTARILMNFILMQHGLPPVIIKTEDKNNYFAALRQADAGLLEPFIEYIGENLVRSLELMVRGAKGESIDEPDDVDKEIALLEQKLQTLGAKTFPKKTTAVLYNFFESSILPLIKAFQNHSEKYSKLYREVLCRVKLTYYERDINLKLSALKFSSFVNLLELDNFILNDNLLIKNFTIECKFKSFNRKGIEEFNYTSVLEVDVGNKDNYKVNAKSHEVIKKYYDEFLSEEEMESLVRSETKAHSEFINKKIEEAQQKLTPKG